MGSLAQTRPTKSGRVYTCKIATVLRQKNADDSDRQAVDEAMADEDLSNASIAAWLGVAEESVRKHRKQVCWCNRG